MQCCAIRTACGKIAFLSVSWWPAASYIAHASIEMAGGRPRWRRKDTRLVVTGWLRVAVAAFTDGERLRGDFAVVPKPRRSQFVVSGRYRLYKPHVVFASGAPVILGRRRSAANTGRRRRNVGRGHGRRRNGEAVSLVRLAGVVADSHKIRTEVFAGVEAQGGGVVTAGCGDRHRIGRNDLDFGFGSVVRVDLRDSGQERRVPLFLRRLHAVTIRERRRAVVQSPGAATANQSTGISIIVQAKPYFVQYKCFGANRALVQAMSLGGKGSIRRQCPPSLLYPPNLVMPRKISFKHIIKTKVFPLKMYFAPEHLKPDYGPALVQPIRNLKCRFRTDSFQGRNS